MYYIVIHITCKQVHTKMMLSQRKEKKGKRWRGEKAK